MDIRELFRSQHARAHAAEVGNPDFSNQDLILRGLSEAHLRARPIQGLNSLAWLFWHMTRDEDVGVNLIIAQRQQVFESGGWSQRLAVTQRDIATGMTDMDVTEFSQSINVGELLAYRLAVGKQTQAIFRDLDPEKLDEVIESSLIDNLQARGVFGANAGWVPQRWLGKPKSFTLMHTVLAHTYFHLGQCEDIRGLLGFQTL